jgi:hypothetical protein
LPEAGGFTALQPFASVSVARVSVDCVLVVAAFFEPPPHAASASRRSATGTRREAALIG